MMILIRLDYDDWLDINEYVFLYVRTWIYRWPWGSELIIYFVWIIFIHTSMSLLILNIIIPLKTWVI